ncbi:MAG: PaaI family thioesterase [Prevotella sp.]|nr:PaaI family thioesterase [Prevotella sp.]
MTLKDFFKKDRFAALAGVELLEVSEGYAKARMLVTPGHLNGGGVCQGGALFTLADLAFAAAINSHLELTFSTSSNITFVANVSEGYVFAEAHEVVDHPKMPYGEVRLTDETGRLLAIFTSSAYRKKGAVIDADRP